LAALASLLSAACVSLSGLAGDASVSLDGAPDGANTSPADASSTGDGATPLEAADAPLPDASAGDAGSFCQQHASASLCLDFDEGSLAKAFGKGLPVSIQVPLVDPPDAGNAALTASTRSPPYAFAASASPIAGATETRVRYEQPVTISGAGAAKLQFDMRLATYAPGQEIDFSALLMNPADGGGATRSYFAVSIDGTGLIDIEVANNSSVSAFLIPGDGDWHTYRVELTVSSGLPMAKVYIDPLDADAGPNAVANSMAVVERAQAVSFELGASVYGPSKNAVVEIDNVLFTAE
jgi:hypothetical protein